MCRTILIAAIISLGGCKPTKGPTPTERFVQHLGGPAPGSLKNVRYDWSAMGDRSDYMSFTLDPADMQALIQRRKFAVRPDYLPPGGERPAWWNVSELSEPQRFYVRENARSVEFLWIDSAGSNAYWMFWGF